MKHTATSPNYPWAKPHQPNPAREKNVHSRLPETLP